MKVSLTKSLLGFIPIVFMILACKPWLVPPAEFEWEVFNLSRLEDHVAEGRNVLVLVESKWGIPAAKQIANVQVDRRIRRSVYSGTLVPMKIEFVYLSDGPPNLKAEYEWVYKQNDRAQIKDSFFMLYLSDGNSFSFPVTVEPNEISSNVGNHVSTYIYWALFVISIILLTILKTGKKKRIRSPKVRIVRFRWRQPTTKTSESKNRTSQGSTINSGKAQN